MIVYISGPVTGRPIKEARAEFAKAAEDLESSGHEAVNPMNPEMAAEGTPWIEFMIPALEKLADCDAIYLLPGWEDSMGAIIEHQFVILMNRDYRKMGKPPKYKILGRELQ